MQLSWDIRGDENLWHCASADCSSSLAAIEPKQLMPCTFIITELIYRMKGQNADKQPLLKKRKALLCFFNHVKNSNVIESSIISSYPLWWLCQYDRQLNPACQRRFVLSWVRHENMQYLISTMHTFTAPSPRSLIIWSSVNQMATRDSQCVLHALRYPVCSSSDQIWPPYYPDQTTHQLV